MIFFKGKEIELLKKRFGVIEDEGLTVGLYSLPRKKSLGLFLCTVGISHAERTRTYQNPVKYHPFAFNENWYAY